MLLKIDNIINKYEDIGLKLNNLEKQEPNNIYYYGTTVKFKNNYYILTCLDELEFIIKNAFKIKIFFNNKDEKIFFTQVIYSHLSLIDGDLNNWESYDCLYDSHLDLLFIKIHDINKFENYVDLNSIKIQNLININNINKNIIFESIKNDNDKYDFITQLENDIISCENYLWFKDHYCLPEIPYFKTNKNDLDILKGSKVTIDDEFIGIFTGIRDNLNLILPLIAIIRSLDYLNGNKLLLLNINTINTSFEIKDKFNNNTKPEYGLCISNDYYDKLFNLTSKEKKNSVDDNKNYKCFKKGNILLRIDDHQINQHGNLIIENIFIPFKSYIWLTKKTFDIDIDINNNDKNNKLLSNETLKIEYFKNKIFTIDNIENKDYIDITQDNINDKYIFEINTVYHKLKSDIKIGINLSDFKFEEYDNTYIFELNEKIIHVLEDLLEKSEYYDIKNYIQNNIFEKTNKKILMIILFEYENSPKLKILKNYNNLDDYNNKRLKELFI